MIPAEYISLIRAIFDKIEFQFIQSTKDLSTSLFDERLTFETRNIHETIAHLIDVCYAYQHLREKKEYRWQSFDSTYVDKEKAIPTFLKIWTQTCFLAYEIKTEKEFVEAMEYLVIHLAYHIGQICAIRMKIDPKWDAKSIYRYK